MPVLNVKQDIDVNYIITPMSNKGNCNYFFQASSKTEAVSLQSRLASGDLVSPNAPPELFNLVRLSGNTPIYSLK